jgi:hypothetical protein
MPTRVDDLTIGDNEVLWRRILPEWIEWEADGTTRPRSYGFMDRTSSAELSVHIATLTNQDIALQGFPNDSLAAIRAGHPRSLGYAIVRDPTDDDPSHALVCPAPKRGHARVIAMQADWVVLRARHSA